MLELNNMDMQEKKFFEISLTDIRTFEEHDEMRALIYFQNNGKL